MPRKIAVLGAGSWGTALAQLLARECHAVRVWDRDSDLLHEISRKHENTRYHPGIPLHSGLRVDLDVADAVGGAEIVVLAVPSHAIREALRESLPLLGSETIFVSAAKGMDGETLRTLSHAAAEILGRERADRYYTALSGPTFAYEVIRSLPTAVTLAARDPRIGSIAQGVFHTPNFRVYTTDDVIGVEIAGALKNVIAILAGVCDGFGFGFNTRAALMTRGMAEIARIGAALGAHPLTFSGLAGMGDLILTCTGDLSRNRRVGLKLAQGKSVHRILRELGQVAEGIRTAKNAYLLSRELKVDVPIFRETYLAIYEKKAPEQAIRDLLTRAPEFERDVPF